MRATAPSFTPADLFPCPTRCTVIQRTTKLAYRVIRGTKSSSRSWNVCRYMRRWRIRRREDSQFSGECFRFAQRGNHENIAWQQIRTCFWHLWSVPCSVSSLRTFPLQRQRQRVWPRNRSSSYLPLKKICRNCFIDDSLDGTIGEFLRE